MSELSAVLLALLGTGLVGAALLVWGVFLGYPPKVVPRGFLSRKEQAIVAACADTLFPKGGPIPLSGTEAGLVPYMDAYVGRVDAQQRVLIRLLLHFVEHGPWLFGPRFARFTRLAPEEQVAALRDMSQSRIYLRRLSFLTVRVMLTMGYLANDEVARCIGAVSHLAPFEADARRSGHWPQEVVA